MPTTSEWTRFSKYARRMRELKSDVSEEHVLPHVFSTLQLRTPNEPLLPNLKALEFKEATADIIPFVPLFLSHMTTHIDIQFAAVANPPVVMVASMIVSLPKLCPHIRNISLQLLSIDAIITSAASEMLLTCNRNNLQSFQVGSPLTEEANRVVYRLPNLRQLFSVVTERPSLPAVSLPSLNELYVEYHCDHDWLRAFHGATLSKLSDVTFRAECDQIGDFLGAFEIAFVSSAPTLSQFAFYTSCSWNPSYHSLLSFKQLKDLVIEFSCQDGCSSNLDDEIITTLAQAMPKLETLQLGQQPCQTPGNVTVRGLIALARHCPCLFTLRIHFRTDSFVAIASEVIPVPSSGPPLVNCDLAKLEVGETPISQRHGLPVFLTLLCIFPRLLLIDYVDEGWRWVADNIILSKRIGSFIHRSGRAHPS